MKRIVSYIVFVLSAVNTIIFNSLEFSDFTLYDILVFIKFIK